MSTEVINRIEVLDTGELFVGIEGAGQPSYQHVYREAAGVYWCNELSGFRSTKLEKWSCSKWFKQIVSVVNSGLGVQLVLGAHVAWKNIPEIEAQEITHEFAF